MCLHFDDNVEGVKEERKNKNLHKKMFVVEMKAFILSEPITKNKWLRRNTFILPLNY